MGEVVIGVDIGGTFTDVVMARPGAPLVLLKVPTTRADPSRAVLQALELLSERHGLAPRDVVRFAHGTTVATNAVLERKGGRTGIITTAGFRDVLEIGRQMRHQVYALSLEPETPVFLAPRSRRLEVRERIDSAGRLVTPLDEGELIAAADALIADGVETMAVVFLFAFLAPEHEQRARDLIAARHPDVAISLSSEVDPTFREYERTAVTAFDAYVKPVVDRYLANLDRGLATAGVPAPLQVMQSRGGLAGAAVARLRPVRLFLSGPAAGVIGARITGQGAGIGDLITLDVGGTSSDIALIEGGEPAIAAEARIDGFPVRVPMIDVNSIGSGGGSIAWRDAAGGLRVGPESAGADPGPACYDRGGTRPTVTDASLVLGYLEPDGLAGGTLHLRRDLAAAAIEAEIAGPLGLSVEEAALGIHRIVNAQMAEGIRYVSIRQGHDPRRFTLLPLGGGGGLHACALASDLSMTRILVPRHPGVLSATGLLAAPLEHELTRAHPAPLDTLDPDGVRSALATLDSELAAMMAKEGVAPGDIEITHAADMCYVGQAYHLAVPLDPSSDDLATALRRSFLAAHDRVYGYAPDAPVRLVNLRSVHRRSGATMADDDWVPLPGPSPIRRPILLDTATGPVDALIVARETLAPEAAIVGPAIVTQPDTTTLVAPGWTATVDARGNLLLTRPAA